MLSKSTSDSNNQLRETYEKLLGWVTPWLTELKKLYPRYTFEILPIVLGATGLITKELAINLRKLKIKNIEETVDSCQRMALIGTMKIVKSVITFADVGCTYFCIKLPPYKPSYPSYFLI